MSVFQYTEYKEFVLQRIHEMPKAGRGEFQRLAVALQMHTTSVSQVFRGEKNLTLEQTARLCTHWGLNARESNYLITLVEVARAGTPELRKILERRLAEMREESRELKHRIPKEHTLDESDRYRFYSDWSQSAIRLLCDVPSFRNIDRIATHLGLPVASVNEAIQFLLGCGLITEEKGQFRLGPGRTFVEANSPLVRRHHANWRTKAVELHPRMKHEVDLAVTSPMTVSRDDAKRIRELLLGTTEKILAINKPSKSEGLHVLNIDWLAV